MDVAPDISDAVAWMAVPFDALTAAEKLAADAEAVQRAVRGVYTTSPVGVYLHRDKEAAGVFLDDAISDQDIQLVKVALAGYPALGDIDEETLAGGEWVKVATSPTLRALGTYLNFFPGKYPGGIPNHPGPVSAMLASGLVGAGLGYGVGRLGETLLPRRWRRGELSRTLAMLGSGGGAALGGVYGATNLAMGRSFNDNRLLSQPADSPPNTTLSDAPPEPNIPSAPYSGMPADGLPEGQMLGSKYAAACDRFVKAAAAEFDEVYKDVFAADTMAMNFSPQPRGSLSINVDSLGRTLWDTGADQQTAGTAMGVMAAAARMPGGTGDSGWVTPAQMGNLAEHMGAGYLSGAIVGSVLGTLTGMPEETQEKLRQVGLYTAIVRTVLPKLF